MTEKRVVLVTGASSGIGRACAELLARSGFVVYGAQRTTPAVEGATMIRMDVTDDASVKKAVRRVLGETGRIDVLINNAGMGIAGSVEETVLTEARRQLETNFFGALRVTQAVLPIMRKQRAGLIINVSSIGGIMGIPFQGLYTASKFAIEGLSEVVHLEASPFGIKVVVVEPTDVKTGFTAARQIPEAHKNSAYRDFGLAVEAIEREEQHGLDPANVARRIVKIVRSRNPAFRYVVSTFRRRLAVWLYRLLPYRTFGALLQRRYKINRRPDGAAGTAGAQVSPP